MKGLLFPLGGCRCIVLPFLIILLLGGTGTTGRPSTIQSTGAFQAASPAPLRIISHDIGYRDTSCRPSNHRRHHLIRSNDWRCSPSTRSSYYRRNHNQRQDAAFRLHSLLSSAVGAADSFWRNSPYLAAALTCGVKASAADWVAQKRQANKEAADAENTGSSNLVVGGDGAATAAIIPAATPPSQGTGGGADLKRNFAYIAYGAVYQGMAQEYIYNHLYPVLFGFGTDLVTVLSKVLFDLLVQTTLVTLPIAYMSKAVIYRYGFREALRRYVDDIRNHGLLTKYFLLWGPVQCLTFSIIPEHFRVTFIAFVSFFWLIILSTIASKTPVAVGKVILGNGDDEECLLEDGQTCRMDG